MNTLQRKILSVSLVVGAVMCLVPPWGHVLGAEGVRVFLAPAGYGFVFSPPTPEERLALGIGPDYGRLGLQVLAVAALCGALMLAAGRRGKDGGA